MNKDNLFKCQDLKKIQCDENSQLEHKTVNGENPMPRALYKIKLMQEELYKNLNTIH